MLLNTRIIWVILGLMTAAVVVTFIFPPENRVQVGEEEADVSHVYQNEIYGVSFSYPDNYVLVTNRNWSFQEDSQILSLYEENDYREFESSTDVREAPPSITFDVFVDVPYDTAQEWVTHADQSNFDLGPQVITKTHVGGRDAIGYQWSGLYEGESVAVLYDGNILLFGVSFFTPEDRIIIDFEVLLQSVEYQKN